MKPKQRTNKRRLIVILFLLASATTIFVLWWTRAESLYQATNRIYNAVRNGDVNVLMSYMKNDEIELNQLTRENFQSFYDNVFKKNLDGFVPEDNIGFTMVESMGALFSSRNYNHPDGRVITLSLVVYKTDGKPIIKTLIKDMLITVLYTQTDPSKPKPSGKEQMTFFAEAIRNILDDLQKTRLPGVVSKRRDGKPCLYT